MLNSSLCLFHFSFVKIEACHTHTYIRSKFTTCNHLFLSACVCLFVCKFTAEACSLWWRIIHEILSSYNGFGVAQRTPLFILSIKDAIYRFLGDPTLCRQLIVLYVHKDIIIIRLIFFLFLCSFSSMFFHKLDRISK